jgi:cyclopropane-fatty-acyl-phospholipid synthase
MMSWPEQPLMLAGLLCVGIQLVAWLIQKQTRNADVVDIAWTLGIVLCALNYLWLIPVSVFTLVAVLVFPVLWYGRLLMHLLMRFDVEHEDSRYQYLRAHLSSHTQSKFLAFFLFQAGLSLLFSLPAYWVVTSAAITGWQLNVALLWGGASLIGVSLADHQLYRFKKTHDSSEVCDVGLWRYSRHPNYFFEWTHWLVYPILLWGSDYFIWSWLIVGLMLLFLLKLTGIPFSEQQALMKRGDAYRTYMKQTSQFILWRKKDD